MTEFARRYCFPQTFTHFFGANTHPFSGEDQRYTDLTSSRDKALEPFGASQHPGKQDYSVLSLIKKAPIADQAWHEAGINVGIPGVHASMVAILLSTTDASTMAPVLKAWQQKRPVEFRHHFPKGEFANVYQTMQNSLHPAVSAPWLPRIAALVEPEEYVLLAARHFEYSPLPHTLNALQNARIVVEAEEAVAGCGSHELFTKVTDMQNDHREHFQQAIYHQRTAIACERGALALRGMTDTQNILDFQPHNTFARDPTGEDMGISGFLKIIAYNIGRPALLGEHSHSQASFAAHKAAQVLHPIIERIFSTFERINERSVAHGLAYNIATQVAIRGIIDYNLALLSADTTKRVRLLNLRNKCVTAPNIQSKPPASGQNLVAGLSLPPLRLPVE